VLLLAGVAQAQEHKGEPKGGPKPKTQRGGGTSGNGGGGDKPDTEDWIPIGPFGEIFSHQKGRPYEEIIADLVREYPELPLDACPGKPRWKVPRLPESMKDAFEFTLDVPRSWPWIWKKPGLVPFSLERLCSNEALISAYGNLVIALNKMDAGDPVGTHLVLKARSLGGPIPIVITAKRQELPAIGGKIEEYTWFETGTGSVHWAVRQLCEGFGCMIARKDFQYVRHELTHVLLWRALGENYPKETVWHDTRFETDNGWGTNWVRMRTSLDAAYIEGIADAMETWSMPEHPYLMMPGNFNSLMLKSDTKDKLCYWEPAAMAEKEGELLGPFANEAYVASTIGALFESYKRQEHDKPIDVGTEVSTYVWHDEALMKKFIDTIARVKPASLVPLARGLDEETGSDVGYRWLREYYFHDYRTKTNTASEFTREEMWKGQPTWCTDASKSDLFLTPSRNARRDEAYRKTEEWVASRITSDQVVADVTELLGQAAASRAHYEESLGKAEDNERLLKLGAEAEGICATEPEARKYDLDDPLIERIYRSIEREKRYLVSMMGIWKLISDSCESKSIAWVDTANSHRESAEKLRDEVTVQGTPGHVERVKAWRSLRAAILKDVGLQADHAYVAQYLELERKAGRLGKAK
ncbi:MAG TPA: hypothetical protein VM598_03035, partial [Bdellovibrionota bacterium]|nr:hypothetical protein [Bdellovibrionota bacterium]